MMTEKFVRETAENLDIPMVGITNAAPLADFRQRLKDREFTPFCKVPPEKRIDFKQAFPEVQTVIVIGLPYQLHFQSKKQGDVTGRIAAFCLERDYHLRVREKLTALAEGLLQKEAFDYRVYVDQAQLIDRASAWRAGLGFFGKNNLLIHPLYGSAFVIGQLLISTSIDFVPAVPMESQCGDCMNCLQSCPNHALGSGYDLNAGRCISYLTQKKHLDEEEKLRLQYWLYGCDFCQLVCPFNAGLEEKDLSEDTVIDPNPVLKDIMSLSDQAFDVQYKETALFWRGKEVLCRNAEILLNDIKAKRSSFPRWHF